MIQNGTKCQESYFREKIEEFRNKYLNVASTPLSILKESNNEANTETKNQKRNKKKREAKKKKKGKLQNENKKEISSEKYKSLLSLDHISLDNLKIKIADLGNGCYTHHHFSTEIQTRQYRSPEVILGQCYDTTADIWSFACMIFELMTGEFLFNPRETQNFSRDEDHLAQIQELLGFFKKEFYGKGQFWKV